MAEPVARGSFEALKSQLRFHLSELSARNAHHEFERLCIGVARLRICSNVIPATGPVGAGGDQGRDFETFHTYLAGSSLRDSSFLAKASGDLIVFACTTQAADDVGVKIKEDVDKICGDGRKLCGSVPRRVYFFSAAPIAVAKRHELQVWARDTFGVVLEILDAHALAEHLSDPDLFHLGVEHLNMSAELYPRRMGEEWYEDLRARWAGRVPAPLNYADFGEIKTGLRHATFNEPQRPDLVFWLNLMERVSLGAEGSALSRKAEYEMIVGRLRGLGSLHGNEDRVKAYVRRAVDSSRPQPSYVDLEDAVTILYYVTGAIAQGAIDMLQAELGQLSNEVSVEVDRELAASLRPASRCELLTTRGRIALLNPVHSGEVFAFWMAIPESARATPLYPVDTLADLMTTAAPVLGDDARYQELVSALDPLVSDRHGAYRTAELARDRALEFYRTGRVLRAIRELHIAQVKWFTAETLRGSVLAMLLLGRWYQEVGLCMAAKYYSLAAGFVAAGSSDPQVLAKIPPALMQAADADYAAGASIGFLGLAGSALILHRGLSPSDGSASEQDLRRALFHTTLLLVASEELCPDLAATIRRLTEKWGVADIIAELASTARIVWGSEGATEKFWRAAEEQTYGPPLGDAGITRTIWWKQLGIVWSVKFKNDYATTQAAEELIAIAQIIFADHAGSELCVLPTTVKIDFAIGDIEHVSIEPIPSNTGREWKVVVPRPRRWEAEGWRQLEAELMSIGIIALKEVCLCSEDEFNRLLERSFQAGLSTKAFVAQPYSRLFAEMVKDDEFLAPERGRDTPWLRDREFVPKEHPDTRAPTGPAPGYSQAKAEDAVRARYEKGPRCVRLTLTQLRADRAFRRSVARLRDAGWKDWHILLAVVNVALNYRVRASWSTTRRVRGGNEEGDGSR